MRQLVAENDWLLQCMSENPPTAHSENLHLICRFRQNLAHVLLQCAKISSSFSHLCGRMDCLPARFGCSVLPSLIKHNPSLFYGHDTHVPQVINTPLDPTH